MAIKDATCPACGKSIKLNDEKPFGFCSFCGHKIDMAEYFNAKVPKASAVQAETDKPEPAAAPISAPTPTPAAAPSIKITQDAQSSAISQIEAMYTLCSTEQEYMGLRQRVLDGAYSDQDKVVMVSELDRLMSKRLHNELALEADLPAAKEEVSKLAMGTVLIAVIGLVVTMFFPIALLITAVLVLCCIAGGAKDRKRKKQCVRAHKRLEQYRKLGYKL
ncbi:hypothetical protein DXB50_07615 [Butyricicoccus sp. OM04-18BH]|nr:hypothetical protein DW766_06800 [Butyricicoccus sp. AM29-23AC]RHV41497.1 hypothetical protein DXB50_07615 [Butyricicoccus sp. OM04-18BH]